VDPPLFFWFPSFARGNAPVQRSFWYNLGFLFGTCMKRFSFLILGLYFLMAAVGSAQNLSLPRDPEKLMLRAQNFWAAVVSRQRLQALEFVLPEKKELYVSGNAPPIVKAKVIGIDLTSDV